MERFLTSDTYCGCLKPPRKDNNEVCFGAYFGCKTRSLNMIYVSYKKHEIKKLNKKKQQQNIATHMHFLFIILYPALAVYKPSSFI